MRKALLVIITLLSLTGSVLAQGWTSALNGNVTLSGSAALFPVGTDSRPSIASQQLTTTGIRFPTAGTQISFIVSGTRQVLFDVNGFLMANNYLNFGTTTGTSGYGLRNNGGSIEFKDSGGAWTAFVAGGANASAKYLIKTADASLPNAQVLGSLASGLLAITTTTGVVSSITTSAGIASNLSDETGSGALVFGTAPTITLGNGTGLPISTGVSGLGTGVATALAVNTGTDGAFVVKAGALGTPLSGVLTNATGLPIGTGISGLGTGIATFLATPSSANLVSALTDKTGSGLTVFQTSPALVTPALGVATATSLAIGGAAIGTNGLAVTGHTLLEGVTSTGATGTGNLVYSAAPTLTGTVTHTGLTDISGASAGQIAFPAAQNASAGANTLDDYEEQSWTPTDSSGAGLTITVNAATYVKIGQQVTAWFDITYPGTASGAGAQLGGLPYASNATGANAYGGPVYVSTYANAISANVATTSTNVKLYTLGNTQLTNANLSGTTSRGFVTYRAGS